MLRKHCEYGLWGRKIFKPKRIYTIYETVRVSSPLQTATIEEGNQNVRHKSGAEIVHGGNLFRILKKAQSERHRIWKTQTEPAQESWGLQASLAVSKARTRCVRSHRDPLRNTELWSPRPALSPCPALLRGISHHTGSWEPAEGPFTFPLRPASSWNVSFYTITTQPMKNGEKGGKYIKKETLSFH